MGFWLSLLWVVFSHGIKIYLWIGAQRAINYFEHDLLGKGDARFTLLNFVWMLVGLNMRYSMPNALVFMEILHGGVVQAGPTGCVIHQHIHRPPLRRQASAHKI